MIMDYHFKKITIQDTTGLNYVSHNLRWDYVLPNISEPFFQPGLMFPSLFLLKSNRKALRFAEAPKAVDSSGFSCLNWENSKKLKKLQKSEDLTPRKFFFFFFLSKASKKKLFWKTEWNFIYSFLL